MSGDRTPSEQMRERMDYLMDLQETMTTPNPVASIVGRRRRYSRNVEGIENVKAVTAALIDASQQFTVTPYPMDEYDIVVKGENAELLDALVAKYG